LGAAYKNRIVGDKAANVEEALACYRRALEVRTRLAAPVEWAKTQASLGALYTERIVGDQAANVEEALACYRHALEVRTRRATARDWSGTSWCLMVVLQNDGRWAEALATARALQAFGDQWDDWNRREAELAARIAFLEPKVEATA